MGESPAMLKIKRIRLHYYSAHFRFAIPIARFCFCIMLLFIIAASTQAQDNYEIEVYGSETVPPGDTMVELHSNFTITGSKQEIEGVLPTEHAFHETLEITQGITPWSEVGFYVFMSAKSGYGYQWVGDHIRPGVRAPEGWHLPVGLSLSAEIGYQRPVFAANTWTLELRPIIDKHIGKYYLSFNPTMDRSFRGPDVSRGFVFSPDFKFSYDITKKISAGLEYYGSLGPITGFDPLRKQQQQIFPVIDLNLSPNWEFNFGVGVGVTGSTDHLIVKMLLGRQFNFKHNKNRAKTP